METLQFAYSGGSPIVPPVSYALVGVVGSGNLEVMIEPAALGGDCRIEVVTAATGFGAIWRAVMDDFFARNRPGDVRITINDVGATPAVVSLRLDQALDSYRGGAR